MSLWDGAGRPATHMPRRDDGSEPAGAAFLCRRPAPHAGDLRGERAIAGVLPAAGAQCLGADPDRPGAPGPRRQPARLPGLRRPRTPTKPRASSMSSSVSATPRRAPIWRLGMVIFAGVDGIRRSLPLPAAGTARLRCPPRSTRRSTISPPAKPPRAGSARRISTPICASNGSRRRKSRPSRRLNCAPTTPRSIEK